MPTRIGVLTAVILGVAFLAASARGEDAGNGITVSGSSKVQGKPTSVEIVATVSGDAELTADAIVKYRDARKRAVAAIEGLKIANLSIDSNGFAVKDWVDQAAQQQAMMRGQVANTTKQKVSVTEQIRLIIKDADKMEGNALMDTMLKVLDTAKDSGLTIGEGNRSRNYDYNNPSQAVPLIAFKITDLTALREQAYKQAMEDAKAKAQRLADLAGVKIGRILSVRDGNQNANQNQNQNENVPPAMRRDPNELVSSVFDEIPLTVSLTVQFEIQK
jgi:uncharacterized protein YggE